MSRKRRNTSSPEPDSPPVKRRSLSPEFDSTDDDAAINQRPQIDQTSGQSGAFPGLANNDELFYGPAADGIDYLRMVRSERKQIPELLTAIEQPEEEDGGYWYDGAYTAQPETASIESQDLEPNHVQQQYYKSLLDQFIHTRARLKITPPLSTIEALGQGRPISCPSGIRAAGQTWEAQILTKDPVPVQVACMDADSILHVINLITRRMSKFFKSEEIEIITRLGAWIWSLLAKFPERGELGSEEISDLRDFTKRAIQIRDWLDNKVNDQTDLDEEGEGEMVGQAVVSNETLMTHSKSDDIDVRMKKRMIIDMIVTVVGELYGQRDLLITRETWKTEVISAMNKEAE